MTKNLNHNTTKKSINNRQLKTEQHEANQVFQKGDILKKITNDKQAMQILLFS